MFCPKCGKEIADDAVVCIHCGRAVEVNQSKKSEHNESKTALGVVFGMFLGLIGLIIGLCMFPEGTVARKTFIKAWLITFLVEVGVAVLFYFVVIGSFIGALSSLCIAM